MQSNAREKWKVFNFFLKVAVHISSRMSAGRAFHADGPEKENALSPNFVRRRGTSYRPLSVDIKRKEKHDYIMYVIASTFFLRFSRFFQIQKVVTLRFNVLHTFSRTMTEGARVGLHVGLLFIIFVSHLMYAVCSGWPRREREGGGRERGKHTMAKLIAMLRVIFTLL